MGREKSLFLGNRSGRKPWLNSWGQAWLAEEYSVLEVFSVLGRTDQCGDSASLATLQSPRFPFLWLGISLLTLGMLEEGAAGGGTEHALWPRKRLGVG